MKLKELDPTWNLANGEALKQDWRTSYKNARQMGKKIESLRLLVLSRQAMAMPFLKFIIHTENGMVACMVLWMVVCWDGWSLGCLDGQPGV